MRGLGLKLTMTPGRRKATVATVACGVLAIAVALAAGRGRPDPRPDGAGATSAELRVRRGELVTTVLLTGEVRPISSESLVVPRTAVRPLQIRWLAEDGSEVRAGEMVIELDSTAAASVLEDLRARLDIQRSQVASERATGALRVDEQRLAVDRRRAELRKAEIEADVPPEVLPRRELHERTLRLERARAALAKAEGELGATRREAEADLRIALIEQSKVERELAEAEGTLDLLRIRAPRSGPFLLNESWNGPRRYAVGDNVWPGWPLAVVADGSEMQVEAWLWDVDDGRIAVGAPAVCVLDAFPRERVIGRVRSVAPAARERGAPGGRRAFAVAVAFEAPTAARVSPGMSARAEVESRRWGPVLLAPRAALDLDSAPPRAATVARGVREVRLGACGPQECVVEWGLEEAERLRPWRSGVGA